MKKTVDQLLEEYQIAAKYSGGLYVKLMQDLEYVKANDITNKAYHAYIEAFDAQPWLDESA
jgi:hypothetical protein